MTSLSARALASLLRGWRDAARGPVYQELADRIRLLILDGRIPLGTRLPAERELAHQLVLSRTTVSSAYASLRDAGFVESTRGSGSVACLPQHDELDPDPDTPAGFVDFGKAMLPAVHGVAGAAERAVAHLPRFLGESGFDPLGLLVARQALAEHYTARGVPTTADQLMITVGAQHAIHLIARTVLSRGDRAVVEAPTFPHALEAIRAAGGRPVPVPVSTSDGWDAMTLEQVFPRTSPVLAYLQPENHNPTGRTMEPEMRERVARLAARQGTVVVADETIAGLGLVGRPTPPPYAASGPAVSIGSLGKSVWGGLRLGWIRADREFIQRAARERFTGDLGTPILDQLILLELLPRYDEILAERRAALSRGRDQLAARLGAAIPEWDVPHTEGGIASWINLGAPMSTALAIAARAEGLILAAGPRFGVEGGVFERFIRVPFTYPSDEIDRGVDRLIAAWSRVRRTPAIVAEPEYAQVV